MPRRATVVLPLPEKRWLTPAEVGAYLSLSERQIRRFIAEDLIKAVRLRSSVRISRDEFERFVAAQEGAA